MSAKIYTQLTQKERYTLELLIQEGYSQKDMSLRLGRHRSTIYREIKRNKISVNPYLGCIAGQLSTDRRKRIVSSKFTTRVRQTLKEKLKLNWNPQEISAYLKLNGIASVSHELMYQYINKDRLTGGYLYTLLPRRGKKYKKRNLKSRRIWKHTEKRNSICDRGNEADQRIKIGHWEGDTVEGKGHKNGIGTFVDRKSRFTIIRKVNDKSSIEMKNAIMRAFSNYPDILKTLTVDNGTEFALHSEISKELNTNIYFAHPYSPWERGTNENTNGLIRRFYPKGTDFTKISEREFIKVQHLLNERPRKCLGYKTPKQVFMKELLKNTKYCNTLINIGCT